MELVVADRFTNRPTTSMQLLMSFFGLISLCLFQSICHALQKLVNGHPSAIPTCFDTTHRVFPATRRTTLLWIEGLQDASLQWFKSVFFSRNGMEPHSSYCRLIHGAPFLPIPQTTHTIFDHPSIPRVDTAPTGVETPTPLAG